MASFSEMAMGEIGYVLCTIDGALVATHNPLRISQIKASQRN